MNYKLLDLQVHGDRRGKLISLEGLKSVPFEIKRIYYMFDTLPNEARGFHAHKDLEQVIIAMDGACRFILDDGTKREQVEVIGGQFAGVEGIVMKYKHQKRVFVELQGVGRYATAYVPGAWIRRVGN